MCVCVCCAVFRLGTSFTQFRAALDTIHLQNPLLRFLVTLNKLNRGFYLLIDHLIWAHRMRIVTVDSKYWSRLSNQCWLLAIILGLLRDLYELLKAWKSEKERMGMYQSYGESVPSAAENNPAVCVDVIKNAGTYSFLHQGWISFICQGIYCGVAGGHLLPGWTRGYLQ